MKTWLQAGWAFCAAASVSAAPVTFQVNMSYQITQGNFDPATGTVEARGAFQSPNTWSGGFTLTNSTAEPTIYTGTYDVSGSEGTAYGYKFVFNNNTGGGDAWEARGDRSFTLESGGQTLPTVYYNDLSGPPPAVDVTFRVDMSVQIAKGTFDPGADTVEARGSFQSPNTWTSGFNLTNSTAEPNIFSGTYTINSVTPGATVEYKFWSSSALGWEGVNNRQFAMPSNPLTLPTVFFNNDIGSAVPVTFSVDMTSQILAGKFFPDSDYVEARGSFQAPTTWTGGFTLTNNPTGENPNIYSNTYEISQAPGTRVEYKFYASGLLTWENPSSTGGGNRAFTLAATPMTLPVASFNDVLAGDILAADTLVTFSVNMTNAHAIAWNNQPAFDFNPETDSVYLNGAFTTPPWWSWSAGFGPEEYRMTNSPGTLVYSITLLMPKGSPAGVNYKYGINGGDNEAPRDQNHFRYVRSTGDYTMPMDTFGVQLVEPAVGTISIGPVIENKVLLSWWGRPGVNLQTTTTLGGAWQNVSGTAGISSTNYPVGSGNQFFRLINQ